MNILDYHGEYTLPGLRAAIRPMRAEGAMVGRWLVKVPTGEVDKVKAFPGFVPRSQWTPSGIEFLFGNDPLPEKVFGACELFIFEAAP